MRSKADLYFRSSAAANLIAALGDASLVVVFWLHLPHKKLKIKNWRLMDTFSALVRTSMVMTALGTGAFGSTTADASARSASLTNDFRFFCMRGKPDFESLDRYATALKLPVKDDLSREMGNGNRVRSRSWTVGDKTGPYELVAGDATNGDVLVETCGIGSADGNGDEVQAELAAHSSLGSSQDSVSPDGRMKTFVWMLPTGEKLVLTQAVSGPGLYLTLIRKGVRQN